MPYCFLGSSIKYQGHTGWKIDDLNPVWVRLLGRSQLSNPSDLPCWSLTPSKLRLCSSRHRAGYFSNLACDWLSIVWAYSEQETESGSRPEAFSHPESGMQKSCDDLFSNTLKPKKWPLFCRQHFQMEFFEWKLLYFDSDFTWVCSKMSDWQ